MLKACGALEFSAPSGTFWAIYDNEFQIAGDNPGVEMSAPALTCRTTDVDALDIKKETLITYGSFSVRAYRVVRDGAGEAVVLLKKNAETGQSWQPDGWQPGGWQPGQDE